MQNQTLEAHMEQIGAAALVVSQLFLAVPAEDLRWALQDDASLQEWPLKDDRSTAGINTLRAALRDGKLDSEEALERDYLYLFTGIGKPLAQPYESPYVSKDGLLFEESTMEVRKVYAAQGVGVPNSRRPDDHIGYEFAFIAQLAQKAAHQDDATDTISVMEDFVRDHLGQFSGIVANSLREHAQTSIYQALADLSEGIVEHFDAE